MDKFILSFINEWSQLKGNYNWITGTIISISFEDEKMTGGFEFMIIILGLGIRIRYNYNLWGSKVGKSIKKYEKSIKKLKVK